MLAFATLATGGLMTLSAQASTPPAYAARASVEPGLYYIGDTAGSLYTFTVKNTGSTTSIGAVEINRPTTWAVSGCPSAPTGWTATTATTKCRYRSADSKSDDIKPGLSKTFGVKAKTDAGSTDRTGTWDVVVSSSNQFDNPSLLKTALSMGSGLSTTLHTFEVTSAVVGTGAPAAGTACPAANNSAIVGSTRTIVVCGRNRANVALTPTAAYSSLGGTFVAVPGTFGSGSIPANSGTVVLARWTGTKVTSTYGTAHKVIVGVGAASNRTSPLRTFTGYQAISNPPNAVADSGTTAEDTPLTVGAPGVLGNDSDPDGDPLTATNASNPPHGSVTLSPNGSFTYTPDANFHGTDSFTYTANDGFTNSAPATVTITVTAVNDAPVAANDTASTSEDAATTVPVLGNDSDVDGDALTVSAVDTTGVLGAVTNLGTGLSYNPNGMFDYLRPGQTAVETITYTVSDGHGGTASATATVTVTGVNDAPVAAADTASTPEDTPVVVSVLANDTDAEGALTLTSVAMPTNGTAVKNGDGTVTFTPAANFSGTGAFAYTVTDVDGATASATATITVSPVADAPDAVNDTAATSEDAATTIPVLANDSDGDGDTLTVSAVDTTGLLGTVTNNGTHVSYDPNGMFEHLTTGQTATETFSYTASDGALTDTAYVTVTITGVNDAPVAADDTATTAEDTAKVVSVLANDTDAEGPLTITGVANAVNGTATNNGDGTITFTPAANFSGTGSFDYTVKDSNNATDTATVTVTVTAVNDAPVANDDAAGAGEDSTGVNVLVLGNDTDPDSTLTVSGVDTTGTSGVVTNHGTHVSYNPNGMFEYLAAGEPATDTFTYTASDGSLTDTATVTVTVTGANDAPVGNDDAYSALQDTPLTVAAAGVLTNDTDVDNGAVKTAGNASTPAHGTVTLNGDGSFTYTPAAGYTGPDSFTYDVSDGTATDGATVTLTVIPPNATPTADATTASGNEDGGAITVTLTGHDDDGDALAFTASTASNGLVTVPSGTSCNALTPSTCTATVTYTPNANFFGADTFTYTVNDGTIDSAPATATLTVNPVNDEPSFTKGADQTVNEDAGARSVSGWATAISAGPANETAQAVSFEVTGTSNNGLFSVLPAVAPNGTLTFTPAPNANGAATVSVRAKDDGGTLNGGDDTGPTQTFTITVNAVNDAPSFTKGADQTLNEDAGAQSVSNWATAISKGPADESGQTLSFTTSNDNNALFSVQPGVSPSGTLVFTPAPNAVGSATVTVTLSDNGGTANNGADTSAPQTFMITVNPVNDAPSFTTAGNQTVLEDAGTQTVNGFVTSTSAGPPDEVAQTVTVAVTSVTNPGLFSTAPTITNGTLAFTPGPNANGVSTVTVRATDDGGTANGGVNTSPTQTFTITVTAVNDAPSFTKGADQTLNEDAGAQSVSNWASPISAGPADEAGQTVQFLVTNTNNALFATQPAVSPTGTLLFTSAANKYGTATVTVTAKDNGGTTNGGVDTSAPQTFTITVNPVNDAPVAVAKSFTVQANMKISLGGLLFGASDPNDVAGDPSWTPTFTVGSVTPGGNCVGCTVSNVDTATGTFDFDPPAGGTGTYTVTYTVVDNGFPGAGATSAPQTITFTVNGPVIWFVDTTQPAGGTGRLSAPFSTLASATTAMGTNTNHRIFVRGGNVTGNVTLPTDGWLLSEAATGTDFDSVMAITPPAGTIARPAVNGTQRALTGTVTLGTNSVVRGFDLTPAGTAAGLVGSGKSGLVVNQMSIQTTTGRAVDLASSSGVFNLTKVSSNGASRGISLVNTNLSTGSFTVTGTGTAGSGGTITNSTATGATGFGLGDGGIYLNNTKNVSLSRMIVSNGQGSGIYGTDVSGFTLASSSVTGNGTDVAKDHDGVHFDTVTGTVSITNTTVSGSKENNVRFRNNSGASTITVTGSTFSNNDQAIGANGLLLDTYNTAITTFTGSGNTFTNNNTVGLALYGNSSGSYTATVNGASGANTFTGNYTGVDAVSNGTGAATFVVDGVSVTGCATCGAPINAYKGTGATGSPMQVTIKNSTIDNQGSDLASGIWVHGEGAGALRGTVTGNVVRGVEYIGIYGGIGNGGAATMDLNISNNDVDLSTAGPNAAYPIFVESGLLPTDTNITCANIKSNKVKTIAPYEGIAVQNFQNGSFRLPGFGGGTDAAAESFIVSGNVSPVTADAVSNTNPFTGGAACITP